MRQFSTLFRRRWAWIVSAILLVNLPGAGGGDIKGISEESQRDWQLNNLARRFLLKDDELAAYNIGVTVKNKVATIWGTVPTAAITKRAEEELRKVPGIVKVVNDCRVTQLSDPVPQALADAVSRALEQGNDASLSAKLAPPRPASSTMASRQVVAKPAFDAVAPPQVRAVEPMPPPPPAVVLFAPVSPGEHADELPAPEKLKLSDKRFKDLTVDCKNGVVKLNGVVARMKDAWDLAEKLNGAPGVKQVIIGNVVEK